MKNNKLVCVILALLVCLSMVISASATTENELSFALESADSSVENFNANVVKVGDEFKMNVIIVNNPGVTYGSFEILFDAEVLELVSATSSVNGVNVKQRGDNKVRVVFGDAGVAVDPSTAVVFNTTGVIAELTFKVLTETEVKSAVEMKCDEKTVLDADCKPGTLNVVADEANVNVITTEHVCDETKTVEAGNAFEPNCTVAGKTTDLLCEQCGKLVKAGEEIPALGHTAGEVVVENEVAADCVTAGGYDNVTYCTVCNAEATRENVVVEALGHTKGEVVVENNVAAGCVTAGGYDNVTYCTVCTAEMTRENVVVEALGHTTGKAVIENLTEASCTVDGGFDNVVYCSVCSVELSREKQTLTANGHPWDDGVITTEPGCDTFGVRTYTCTKCGETKADDRVPGTGHAYGEYVVTTEPTTEAEGVETSTCANCDAKETRSIAKLTAEPAPKSNVLVIVIAVVCVVAAAGVAAFVVLKNKKK